MIRSIQNGFSGKNENEVVIKYMTDFFSNYVFGAPVKNKIVHVNSIMDADSYDITSIPDITNQNIALCVGSDFIVNVLTYRSGSTPEIHGYLSIKVRNINNPTESSVQNFYTHTNFSIPTWEGGSIYGANLAVAKTVVFDGKYLHAVFHNKNTAYNVRLILDENNLTFSYVDTEQTDHLVWGECTSGWGGIDGSNGWGRVAINMNDKVYAIETYNSQTQYLHIGSISENKLYHISKVPIEQQYILCSLFSTFNKLYIYVSEVMDSKYHIFYRSIFELGLSENNILEYKHKITCRHLSHLDGAFCPNEVLVDPGGKTISSLGTRMIYKIK